MSSIITNALIVLLLIIANGVFALSEIAIVSARKTRLKQKAAGGDAGAKEALKLSKEPTRFLSTVQVGITMIGILSGAFGGATIAEELSAQLSTIAWLDPYSDVIGVGIVVVVITYLSLIVGELVPKRIALNNAEKIAAQVAAPMSMLARLATPVVWLLSLSTEAVLRLIGNKPSLEPSVTEEEVKMLIYEGTRLGVFEDAEHEIVDRVFRLGDRRASSLMTYRTAIVFLDIEDPLETNLNKIHQAGYSRFPVCKGNLDNIQGVVTVKDLFAQEQSGQMIDINAALRPPIFAHESLPALKLLEFLREKRSPLVLVIDEFGSIIGLVTLHDVLTAIVGDLPMLEDDDDEPEVVERADGSFLLSGVLAIDELKDLLELGELPEEDETGYETLGGMLMAKTGRILDVGEVFQWGGWRFEVMDMDGLRVDKVLVSRDKDPTS
jgi:putative hemolysin